LIDRYCRRAVRSWMYQGLARWNGLFDVVGTWIKALDGAVVGFEKANRLI
jgi:hypothetical protein